MALKNIILKSSTSSFWSQRDVAATLSKGIFTNRMSLKRLPGNLRHIMTAVGPQNLCLHKCWGGGSVDRDISRLELNTSFTRKQAVF